MFPGSAKYTPETLEVLLSSEIWDFVFVWQAWGLPIKLQSYQEKTEEELTEPHKISGASQVFLFIWLYVSAENWKREQDA